MLFPWIKSCHRSPYSINWNPSFLDGLSNIFTIWSQPAFPISTTKIIFYILGPITYANIKYSLHFCAFTLVPSVWMTFCLTSTMVTCWYSNHPVYLSSTTFSFMCSIVFSPNWTNYCIYTITKECIIKPASIACKFFEGKFSVILAHSYFSVLDRNLINVKCICRWMNEW
jgi:hypothetical protein